ncbi:hypothetical protein NBO_2g0055 [Nosema bombycis CQ1]|uniref:Uncharacterized protein n=1 Tax=Nosema bombycis (strain CQ1 / CVCC 102059) TaxID=578461 RepID=R0MRN1_NOSB1|nr:hypothetical protein NBO_2g0055 [Nosema bombycis CQ1]|eukprot:EOB15563.1 hypothetical protein NBO_2g0055 [Nosema bombycis CQ1]
MKQLYIFLSYILVCYLIFRSFFLFLKLPFLELSSSGFLAYLIYYYQIDY